MNDQNHPLNTLQDIKKMMERSSRFISLSGLSGIAAGVCALAGAWFANNVIKDEYHADDIETMTNGNESLSLNDWLNNELVRIAATTFIAAFVLSFIFTFWRSKRTNTPVWGAQARRLMINVAIPMVVGGIFLFALIFLREAKIVA